MAYFKTHDNPVTLTEEVWFYITYHFCLRSAKMQAMLRVDDLLEKEEENGQSCFVLSTAYSSKNHRGGLVGREKVSNGRIQSPRQVRALKKLISLIDPRTLRLFQMAKKRYSSEGPWYTGQPLGKNTMNAMMKRLFEKAKLSKSYTNHCVRATCTTRLAESGADDRASPAIA